MSDAINSPPDAKYWAFISYSHADRPWGDWLHHALETYRVPPRLVGADTRHGKAPARLYPIFRDREELPVSADLGENINQALVKSRSLVVICSPRAAASHWVNEEILAFKRLGREGRVLALIVAGEPNASENGGKPGFAPTDECFPPALRFRLDADGALSTERTEPIAADAREGKDGKSNAKLKLLAGLLGVDYDALRQRDHERRQRRLRAVAAAALALTVVFAGLALYALAQTSKAKAANRGLSELLREASRSDAATSRNFALGGEWGKGLIYLGRALRYDPQNGEAARRLWTEIAYGQGDRAPFPRLAMRHGGILRSLAFSPDGRRIATCGDDGVARQWDAGTGQASGEPLRCGREVRGVAYSPDGRRILTVSEDGAARQWDAGSGRALPASSVQTPYRLLAAAYSPDGRYFVTGGTGCSAQIWDAANGQALGQPMLCGEVIYGVAYSPDGRRIATASQDKRVRQWDAATGKTIGEALTHPDNIWCVVYSPDGTRLLTGCRDLFARQWDAATGKLLGKPLEHAGGVLAAAYSPDGSRIVAASRDGIARQWDAATGEPLGEPLRHDGKIYAAAYSPDGGAIATAGDEGVARLWDAASVQPRGELLPHAEAVRSAAYSPDGRRVLTAGDGFAAQQWQAHASQKIGPAMPHGNTIYTAVYSPDGRRVLTAGADGAARQWDAGTGQSIGGPLRHGGSAVRCAVYSPDGRRILTAGEDGTARQWDAGTGQSAGPAVEPFGQQVLWAAYRPDGRRFVTASSEGSVQQWDAATGGAIGQPLPHSEWVWQAVYSPDGARILTVCNDNFARQWNAADGQLIEPPLRHDGKVWSAVYSPDGARILTASASGNAQEWDAASGLPLGAPLHEKDWLWSATYSPDGRRIVTACATGTAQEWALPPATLPSTEMSAAALTGLTEALSGLELDPRSGELHVVRPERRQALLAELRALPGSGGWLSLAHWAVADAGHRTYTFASDQTSRQAVTREILDDPAAALPQAMALDPSHPLLPLALAGRDEEPAARRRFLRQYAFRRLEAAADAGLWRQAASVLRQQEAAEPALDAAQRALALRAGDPLARRTLAWALSELHRPAESLAASETLLASAQATGEDFARAGYQAALLGQAERARALFAGAAAHPPPTTDIACLEGWSLLNLHAPAVEILAVFRRAETLLAAAGGEAPGSDVLAGLTAARWLTGDRDGAVADCQRLIADDADFADAAKITALPDFSAAEKVPLLAAVAETLRRHPELAPKKAAQ